ncbi:MAG: ATP-binding protein [Polyangiaceae bacterium]
MYIGDVHDGSGLAHMVWEVLSNALDLHLAGRAIRISIEIRADGAVSVDDDGPGFPRHEVDGVPFVELALTRHHSTPTLDGHAPHEHVGRYSMGVFVISALSSWLLVEVFSNGRRYEQRFERGVAVTRLSDAASADRSGTRVTFLPDPQIFSDTWLDAGVVAGRLRELVRLLPGLSLEFSDLRKHPFYEPSGLQAFLERADEAGETLLVNELVGDVRVEVAARWHSHRRSTIESFANIERTTDGGSHVRGLINGLVKGLRRAAPKPCDGMSKKQLVAPLSRGLDAVVCVRLNDPTYDAPTKTKLLTPAVEAAVKAAVSDAFTAFLRDNRRLRRRFTSAL